MNNKTKSGVAQSTIIENWAGNFGTSQDREGGKREIEFHGSLLDTSADVSLCLETVPEIVDKIAREPCTDDEASGFYKLVKLVIESAQKTLAAVIGENLAMKRELVELQGRKNENQGQPSPMPFFGESAEYNEFNAMSLRYAATYAGYKAHALGLIMADMLSSEAREILIGMIMNGKSIDEIKKQVGFFEMSEEPATV